MATTKEDKKRYIRSVPLDEDTMKAVVKIAEQEDRPVAQMLRLLIKKGLKKGGAK